MDKATNSILQNLDCNSVSERSVLIEGQNEDDANEYRSVLNSRIEVVSLNDTDLFISNSLDDSYYESNIINDCSSSSINDNGSNSDVIALESVIITPVAKDNLGIVFSPESFVEESNSVSTPLLLENNPLQLQTLQKESPKVRTEIVSQVLDNAPVSKINSKSYMNRSKLSLKQSVDDFCESEDYETFAYFVRLHCSKHDKDKIMTYFKGYGMNVKIYKPNKASSNSLIVTIDTLKPVVGLECKEAHNLGGGTSIYVDRFYDVIEDSDSDEVERSIHISEMRHTDISYENLKWYFNKFGPNTVRWNTQRSFCFVIFKHINHCDNCNTMMSNDTAFRRPYCLRHVVLNRPKRYNDRINSKEIHVIAKNDISNHENSNDHNNSSNNNSNNSKRSRDLNNSNDDDMNSRSDQLRSEKKLFYLRTTRMLS